MIKKIKDILRQPYRDLRTFFYKVLNNAYGLDPKCYLIKPKLISKDVKIGAYSHFSYGATIGTKVEIGKYVMCGPEVSIAMGDHNYKKPGKAIIFSGSPKRDKTIIKDDVWLGTNSLIKAGVTIGEGAIVAMGSVVVKDVPEYTIVGGVPAKYISNRFDSEDEKVVHQNFLKEKARKGVYTNGFD